MTIDTSETLLDQAEKRVEALTAECSALSTEISDNRKELARLAALLESITARMSEHPEISAPTEEPAVDTKVFA